MDIPKKAVRLIRFDTDQDPIQSGENENLFQVMDEDEWPNDRHSCITHFSLPRDSIIKVYYEGHLIPWSLVQKCPSVEIKVYRPNQNVKPKSKGDVQGTEALIREKVSLLESRISSLEAVVNPETMQMKTDRDLQLLTKQISFLSRRLEEADQSEWIKKT